MYFLWITRLYLNPALDEEKIKFYIANIGWEYEFGQLIKKGLWQCADNPENNILVNKEQKDFEIITNFSFPHGDVEHLHERTFSKKVYVKNVRLWAAKFIVNDWSKKAKKFEEAEDHKKPYLRFVAKIDDDYPSDNYKVASVPIISQGNTNIQLNAFSKLLLRYVYIFKKRSKIEEGHSVTDILKETARSVISSVESSNLDAFERDFRQLWSIHTFVILLSYEDTPTKDYNVIEKLGHDFWDNLSRSYLNQYREIFEFGLYEEKHSQRYFDNFCHAPVYLLRRTWEVSSHQMRVEFLQLFSTLHFEFDEWWQNEVDEKIGEPHDKDYSYRLLGYRGAQHTSKLRKLVSSWESISSAVISFSYKDDDLLSMEAENKAKLIQEFMSFNLRMISRSVLSGDINNAEWMADSFLRFPGSLTYKLEQQEIYGFSGRLVHLNTLTSETGFGIWSSVFQSTATYEQETPSQHSLQKQAYNNLHEDMRLLGIVALLNWNINLERMSAEQCKQHTSLIIIKNLLEVRLKDNTGGILHGMSSAFNKPADVFNSLIRYFYSGELYEDGSYRAALDHQLQSFERMAKPEMVPGRSYSSSGRSGLSESLYHIAVILLSLIPDDNDAPIALISGEWLKAFPGLKSQRITRFVESLSSVLATEDTLNEISNIYWNLNLQEMPEGKVTRLKEALEKVTNAQDDHIEQTIINAEIDEGRKSQILVSASSNAFSAQYSDFPVCAFHEIKMSGDVSEERHRDLNFLNHSKGELTNPPLVDLAINEDDYLAQTVSSNVAGTVFSELFVKETAEVIQEYSLDDFLKRVFSFAEGLREPCLILPYSVPKWMSEWKYAWGENKDSYSVQFEGYRDESDSTIIGRIMDPSDKVHVIVRQISGIVNPILFDQDKLTTITFKSFKDNLPLDLNFDPNKDSQITGTLRFTWGYVLDELDLQFFEIGLPKDDDA